MLAPTIALAAAGISLYFYLDSKTEHWDKEKSISQNLEKTYKELREQAQKEKPIVVNLEIAVDKDTEVKKARGLIEGYTKQLEAVRSFREESVKGKDGNYTFFKSTVFKDSKAEQKLITSGLQETFGIEAEALKGRFNLYKVNANDLVKLEIELQKKLGQL